MTVLVNSAVVGLLGVLTLAAQSQPAGADGINTDRPDFTDSTHVIAPGILQLESGAIFQSEGGVWGPNRDWTLGNLLVRFGIGRRTELRLEGDGFRRSFTTTQDGVDRQRGFSDFALGAKIRIFEEKGLRPAFSVIPMLSAPVGQGGFSSSGYDPLVKLALSKELPRGFGIGSNINLAAPSDPAGRWFQSAVSVSVDHDLPLGLSGYWELYRVTPAERDGRADLVADTGLLRALGRNAQVDLEAGRRLSPWKSSWFIGAGFAVRIDLRR